MENEYDTLWDEEFYRMLNDPMWSEQDSEVDRQQSYRDEWLEG